MRRVAESVRNAYAAGGLPAPGEIVWAQGPADLAAAWAKRRHAAGDNVRALIIDAVRRKTETGRRPRHLPARAHGPGE